MQLLFLLALILSLFSYTLYAQPYNNPTSHPPAAWTKDFAIDVFGNNSIVAAGNFSSFRMILSLPHSVLEINLVGKNTVGLYPILSCGFLSNHQADALLFVLMLYFVSYTSSPSGLSTTKTIGKPQVLWSANRDRPVREDAALDFTKDGNLALRDVDGTVVWSTGTSGKSVVEMKLTDRNSLVLFDDKNVTVWTSEDHPTDTWFLGQTLREGQRLTSNASATNSTRVTFHLSVVRGGMEAYIDSDPPQLYYRLRSPSLKSLNKSTDATYDVVSGSIVFASSNDRSNSLRLPTPFWSSKMQFMRLESDGHLRLYGWDNDRWNLLGEAFNSNITNGSDIEVTPLDECSYPMICGEYGFCFNGKCSCADLTSFRQVDERQLNLGCSLVTPLSCQNTKAHHLFRLPNASYFNYIDSHAAIFQSTNEEHCKEACLRNCSCKAAFFKFADDIQNGSCYLPSQLYSVMSNNPYVTRYNSSAYIKVQKKKVGVSITLIVGIILGALLFASLVIGYIIFRIRRKRALSVEKEENFELIAGLPKRFSFEELRVATENFRQKLGQGGFGSVFEGTLNGEKVAVKLLEGVGQGMKEFLAEVKTIGNVHHINLVRLKGFCSEKSNKLLVYEYMCNGSLDKWIFGKNQDVALDWQTRFQIIMDVAKGLSYLHEDCMQRIAHFDIKPQNILLDSDFHAKVSDFGLSKLIDRELSHVLTTMRGTRGYLAPEWLSSKITEKADVYSFGVVVMEIVCGRKNLDHSQPEECIHLISMLQNKAQTNQLLDLVSIHNLGVLLHEDEIMKMIKLAMWCLQNDSARRPSMSLVVQVLEGSVNVETDINYNITDPTVQNAEYLDTSASQVASLLSGPR